MSSAADGAAVNKDWNYAQAPGDAGVSYGEYVEQITCLLPLKTDQEGADDLDELIHHPGAASLERVAGTKKAK